MPRVEDGATEAKRASIKRALDYMGLKGGEKIADLAIDRVFIGSCTNGRIEDLRAAAKVVAGRTVSERVNAMVVPGSGLVKAQAEAEGLDKIFVAAGFEWREPGCSMCLAMNPDKLAPGERCASTSNRNFEGRQGYKGRTHLVSPAMAAAAAIAGTVRRRQGVAVTDTERSLSLMRSEATAATPRPSWPGLTRPSKRRRRIETCKATGDGPTWMAGSSPAMTQCGAFETSRFQRQSRR